MCHRTATLTAQAAGGRPTTWVWAPRAWVTPMVRVAAAIIGRRWLTTRNWAESAWLAISRASRSTFTPSRKLSTSSRA